MEIKPYSCPTCGAALEADEFTTSIRCPNCGVTSQIQKDRFDTNYN